MCVNREQLGPHRQQWGSSRTRNGRARHFPFLSPPQCQCFWPTILEGRGQVAPARVRTFYKQHFRVRPTPQSALPERNITIQAFALVQTSAELKANLLKTFASPFKGPLQSKALSLLTVQSWLPPAGWRQAFRGHPLWLFSARLLSGLFLHFARGLSFPSFPMLLTFTGKHQSDSSEIMLRMIWGCATPLGSLL